MRRKMDDYTAGELRQRVVVQRSTLTPDGSGGQKKTWADLITLFCFVEEKGAGERTYNGQLRTQTTWEFTTWYRTDVLVTDRIYWKGKYWDIKKVEDVLSRGKFTRMSAESGVES